MTTESVPMSSPNEPTTPVLGVPALVVSGFLGAGKTTLVKHLIADAQQQGLKLAVVSNEFGELGIDRAASGSRRAGVCGIGRRLCLLSINQ